MNIPLDSLDELSKGLSGQEPLALNPASREAINRCRAFLDQELARSDKPVYGVNTGFGALYSVSISDDELEELQENMVKSHACGLGEMIPPRIIKIMLLLKIQALSQGYSGICEATVQRLIDFYNADVLPVVFDQGSLGASGDLAPLAHLSLPLLGLGEVWYKGQRKPAAEVTQQQGWQPLRLRSKEGVALLNGTQFMTAYGVYILLEARRLFRWAEAIAALSIDAFDCRIEPFDPRLQELRHHDGQRRVASAIREWLSGSELLSSPKEHVQDPYSFRCIPQVLGASYGVLQHAEEVFGNELKAVTDNPIIFPEEGEILSGGNFHGQPLALALDYLSLALHEAGSIAERRIYQLVSGKRGLPPFLVAHPGLHSGLMIAQYTAASIVSQNKQWCTPASADSIESSAGQEDHVSMGANAATKAFRILENLEKILAIELLTASQAIEFRRPLKTSPALEALLAAYREKVPFIDRDRILHYDIEKSINFLRSHGGVGRLDIGG